MKFSIVTPCYNSEQYIVETIESVVNQKGDFEIEYIIVDGASTDNTLKIINKYKKKLDSKKIEIHCSKVSISIVSEKDNGMYDAIYKGLKLASGDIVAYINSDDYYLPNAFIALKTVFENYKNINWVTGIITRYNEYGNITLCKLPYKYNSIYIQKGIYGKKLPFIQQESCFWRKKLLDKVDLKRFSSFIYAGDYFLWHEFSKYSELRILNVPVSGFRKHGTNKSKDIDSYFSEFNSIISKKTSIIDKLQLYVEQNKWDKTADSVLKLNKNIIDLSQQRLCYLLKTKKTEVINNPIVSNNKKNNDVFLSVVTVTYNAEEFLERTINSVVNQKKCNFEYIVIDGASIDKTVDIIKRNEEKINIWLSEPDDGLYYAMNKGIAQASGKYVLFLNAGDCFSTNSVLEQLYDNVDMKTDDVVYGDRYYIYENGTKSIQKARPISTILERMPFGHQACMIKSEILKNTLFNTTYKYSADYNLLLGLYLKKRVFKYVGFPICDFLHGGASESGIRPHLDAIKVIFDNCDDKEIIKNNHYFKSFKSNCQSLLDI